MDSPELSDISINTMIETKPEWTVHTLSNVKHESPSASPDNTPLPTVKHESPTASSEKTSSVQLHLLEHPTPDSVLSKKTLAGAKQEPPEHEDMLAIPGIAHRELTNIKLEDSDHSASNNISNEDIGKVKTECLSFTKTHYQSTKYDMDNHPYPVTLYQRQTVPTGNVLREEAGQDGRTTSDRTTHMRTNNGGKSYLCSMCGYRSTKRCHFIRHMRMHSGEKPYSCTVCDYRSANTSDLYRHTRTHTGEKPYGCSMCDYRCNQNSDLVTHMRIHTGEKPYSCSLCVYKCGRKRDLSSHMRIHTGEKPYTCSLCVYKCGRKSQLSTHMRTHTGEKPYGCSMCDYRCAESRQLLRHTRTHTGEKL